MVAEALPADDFIERPATSGKRRVGRHSQRVRAGWITHGKDGAEKLMLWNPQ
jgi:hypothetical protein